MAIYSESQIDEMAKSLLTETDLLSIPVDVYKIAQYKGFSLFQHQLDHGVSGLIVANDKVIRGFNSKKVMVVNESDSPLRKRFTIAHELGHYVLAGSPEQCYAHRDVGDYGQEERDANRFASALLMPKEDIMKEVARVKEKYPLAPNSFIIVEIAQAFLVSENAAEVRLKKLDLI